MQIPTIEKLPGFEASVEFTTSSDSMFREMDAVNPVPIDETRSYMPWGAGNQLPYDIIDMIESDETLSTCMQFNAEVFYGAGLDFDTCLASEQTVSALDDFRMDNDLTSFFMGTAHDLKYFNFAVSVVILNADGSRIVSLRRKEACYCRFSPVGELGFSEYVHYANWRNNPSASSVETIPLLNPTAPLADLNQRMRRLSPVRKFAIVTRVPNVDSPYYPIPHYASLFLGKWYKIKQYIGIAKEAKLRNAAPIKYHVEIRNGYWDDICDSEGISDPEKRKARRIKGQKDILEFLSGAENSGKVWFSMFYRDPTGKETRDIVIHNIENGKEGGDWQTDLQEVINMMCFTLRVHSNLVGSVPGKTQTNNSGSDKRELYTMSQALQKPYHDLIFRTLYTIMKFNRWDKVTVRVPLIQLTTLDEHRDVKQSNVE